MSENTLDEERWQAWRRKGNARDRRGVERRLKLVQYAEIFTLLAAAALWPSVAPYALALWSIVTLGAVWLTWQALERRSYALAVVFAGLAVLYNPVFPLLPLAGGWQRVLVAASVAPFLVSLAWRQKGERMRAPEK